MAKASSARTHNHNFDPTPAAKANLPPPEIARSIPCRFFPIGTCKYGDQCVFSHGIPGVAGSPGVPSSAVQESVQGSTPAPYSSEEFSHEGNGMPMYYPQQMQENAHEYGGYQQQFAPQQGYYPFPPNFHHYPQHYQQGPPMQQPYYQQIPIHHAPLQMHSEVPPASVAASGLAPSDQSQAPSSPALQQPEAGFIASFPSPSAPQGLPLLPQQAYPSFPPQDFGFAPNSAPPQSIHTFFQTGAPTAPNGQYNAFPKSPSSGRILLPRQNVLRPSSSISPSSAPFAYNKNVPNPRPRFGSAERTPRPPCSYFEANRCQFGDECSFVHLLPDGKDARHLAQGLIGQDGRISNPEERGGIPPIYKGPKGMGYNGNGFIGGQQRGGGMNGYAVKPKRFEDGTPQIPVGQRPDFDQEVSSQAQHAQASPFPRAFHDPHQMINGAGAPLSNFGNGSAAPSLVAAINGLTRRIPPVNSAANALNGATGPTAATPAALPQQSQRVPSGDDFPALSAPLSPSLNGQTSSPSSPKAPTWSAEASRELSASTVIVEHAQERTEPVTLPLSPKSDHSESEFVMVNHADAPIIPATTVPVVEIPDVVPAVVSVVPKVMLSFASAAARGAAIVAPIVAEKPKRAVVLSSIKPMEEAVVTATNSAGGAGSKKKDNKRGKRSSPSGAGGAGSQQVAVKA